ncbi:MAG: DUF2807 domain-containing protein [Bacteroidales bacterium]
MLFGKGYIVVFIITFILTGCEKVIFSGEGEVVILQEEFDSFSKISFYDIFAVELRSDSIFSVEIETRERYLDQISFSVDSGNLVLHDHNKVKWLPDYSWPVVRISFPELTDQILLESPVIMTTRDTLHAPSLNILSLGKTGDLNLAIDTDKFQFTTGSDNSGYYRFSGRTTYSKMWPRGSSIIDASGLEASHCYIYNNSIGDCTVRVNIKLEARLNTMGNVYYYGNPQEVFLIEESGSGRLISK